jgi:hypothetical protein
MALGLLLTKELVAAPIGANTPEQLANSLGAALKLSADEMKSWTR